MFGACLIGHVLEAGCTIAIFIQSLLMSGWSAAGPYEIKDIFAQSLAAYYMLLLASRRSVKLHKRKWSAFYLPATTLRNLLCVAVHCCLACLFWPADLHWRPRARTELPAEVHFGAIKRWFRGQPSIKAGYGGKWWGMGVLIWEILGECGRLWEMLLGSVALCDVL